MNVNLKKMLILLCAAPLLLSSCTKKDGGVMSQATGEASSGEAQTVTGVIYANKAALYVEDEQGKMKWSAEAVLGDVAAYLGEKKEAVRTDGQKRTFFHIRLNENEYWIQDYCYEPNTFPAFISKPDTVLYKSENILGVTDEIMPQFFVVAVYNDKTFQDDGLFVRIAAYCPELAGSSIIKDKFVKRDNVETGDRDVRAMMIAQVATESRNDIIRAELFTNAAALSDNYADEIEGIRNLTETIIAEENYLKTLTIEKVSKNVTAADDVELLSVPSFDSYDVRTTAALKSGSSATALQKTTLTDDEGNEVDWYYVKSKQQKGWTASYNLSGL
ncbi:MAG: hypothetical protein ACTTKL_02510 [Treponema sp.]